MKVLILFGVIALVSTASSRSVPEDDSVVSVYTTLPTAASTGPALDVYQTIANNIAQRITSPIYRFLGLNQSNTDITTKNPSMKIEILEDPPSDVITTIQHVDNNIDKIDKVRDVEELSVEASRRTDNKKPEKVTLYSSYLPVKGNFISNHSINEVNIDDDDDDDFNFDEDKPKPKATNGGMFVYILEWLASAAQIAYGFLEAIFKPRS